MKIAIYLRTSKTDQILDNQKIPLVNYAKAQGWDYEIFQEQESTRKTRPVQYDLFNNLLKKKYDGLLIYKFDRWARSSQELITHMNELNERGVRFISYSENIDLGTASGKLMFQIIAAFAEFERNMIRERTIAGLDRARAWGKKLGRPRKVDDKKEVNIEQFKDMYTQGLTIRQIAEKLRTSKYRVEKALKHYRENKPPLNNQTQMIGDPVV